MSVSSGRASTSSNGGMPLRPSAYVIFLVRSADAAASRSVSLPVITFAITSMLPTPSCRGT
eukprot:7391794-Prymnesium_polylepis.2